MALVVETGTGTNPNADSYISEADAITRAAALGLDFPGIRCGCRGAIAARCYLLGIISE